MALQFLILLGLGYAGYQALQKTNYNQEEFERRTSKPTTFTPSAFVGYDEPGNVWPDPLMVTFNKPHLPLQDVEVGPYGVPRRRYRSQYGESMIPLYGPNIEKI